MDLNFADLKKEASTSGADAAKQVLQQAGHELLGDGHGNGNASAASHQDDNAHTEHYFSNDRKLAGHSTDFDFEHLDPQAFVQRMSAGAKEAHEQLDAKFAQTTGELGDFLGNSKQALVDFGAKAQQAPQGMMADMTRDFMNAERGLFGRGDIPKTESATHPTQTTAVPAPATWEATEEMLRDYVPGGNGDGHFKPSAPTAPPANQMRPPAQRDYNFYDDVIEDDFVTTSNMPKAAIADVVSTASTRDSDTDSPSVSYNPSPAKKHPIADALKEQDSEKFISSEDLLGDFKEERVGPPKPKVADTSNVASNATAVPTTDLDADDDLVPPAEPAKLPKSLQNEELKDSKPAAKVITAAIPTAPAAATEAATTTAPKQVTVTKDNNIKTSGLISVEEIFYKYGLDAWFKPERLHPKVESLIYWRDVKKSGIVFGTGIITLLAISCFSVISVFAYLSLITLTGTIAFRIYKSLMQAIQKTNDGHPFKEYLDIDLTLSQDKIQNIAGVAVAHINGFTAELRRLFLVEDLIDSIKFGVILWVMTYVGAWFNGMTLVILVFVSLFTLPKVYENNKQSIDTYLELVRSKLTEITDKIKAAIPIGNKKPIAAESDKDK